MFRTTLAITLVALSQVHAEVLMWNGRALDMASSKNVRVVGEGKLGAEVDLTKEATFSTIEFGSPDASDPAVELRATDTFNMGNKIVFTGKTKIILGTGKPGSKAKLSLAGPKDSSNEGKKVAYVPGSRYAPWDTSKGSEFMCHKNWVVVNDDGKFMLPYDAATKEFRGPQSGDTLVFPVGSKRYDPADPASWKEQASDNLAQSFYATTKVAGVTFKSIKVGDTEYTSCTDFTAASTGVKLNCDDFTFSSDPGAGTSKSNCSAHVEVHAWGDEGKTTEISGYIQQIDTDDSDLSGDFHVESNGEVLPAANGKGPKYLVGLSEADSDGKITVTVTDADTDQKIEFDPNTFTKDKPGEKVVAATAKPTAAPTSSPTVSPTTQPTTQPTESGETISPVAAPTDQPTEGKTVDTEGTTVAPTDQPTEGKTVDTEGTTVADVDKNNEVSVGTATEQTAFNKAVKAAEDGTATQEDKDKLVKAAASFIAAADKALPVLADSVDKTAVAAEQTEVNAAKAQLAASQEALTSLDPGTDEYTNEVKTLVQAQESYKEKQLLLSKKIQEENKKATTGKSTGNDDDKDGGGSTVIIAVVVVVVVLVAAIAVVVVQKGKGGGSGGGDGQRAVVSFENPMYDTVKQGQGGAPAAPAEGFYAEPGADATSGYQDVGPATGGFDGAQQSTGYMDVGGAGDGGAGGGGYMDVAPNAGGSSGYMDVGGADNYDDDGEEDV